ncbi:3-ketoacyl-CoA thiolase, mitochondrial [Drosophila sulfurigaster albostrigata]|uniref:3-ketoacyl-CoA thiolase, mitochondrial n=1 Tax=Drosophila albomicans TaxID=7291 RepID=A0A6P8WBV8_DROAB|nr:3-ketoacyl-CoA thiolase, mitochondrial [Drosophila albomicans]XP_062121040.1 3-ketoacyl-CoA thiolase, mitochondrial [Drosophila sulfurigaster albostrigata]
MSAVTKGIYIVAAKRTAFGTFGGALKNVNQTQLQTTAAKAALDAAGLKGEQVDTVIVGNVIASSSTDGIYVPRHVGLNVGVPIEKPALGINRLCGSGFQSIVNGAQDILVGGAKVALTGGVESMSQTPFIARNIRFGTTLGANYNLEDALWAGLTDTHCKLPMALTAENLADQYKITRERVDEFSLRSQKNWEKGQQEGAFNAEIAPIKLKVKGKEVDFVIDEHPRPKTTLEGLAKLPSLFKKNGVVTAGTASGICDGAAAVVVASEEALKEYNLKPLARLVAFSFVGVKPEIMGIGPVPAIQNVLRVSGKKLEDIDLIEINEAFAAQTLACADALKLDTSKLNVNGGAIALGHPLGASGSRITGHLVHELQRKKLKYGIGSACIGGGQGIALLLEAV